MSNRLRGLFRQRLPAPIFTVQDLREARRTRHNERVKLVATGLNGIATAIVATGIVGPIVTLFIRKPDTPLADLVIPIEAVEFIGVWCGLGLALHLAANFVLRWIR